MTTYVTSSWNRHLTYGSTKFQFSEIRWPYLYIKRFKWHTSVRMAAAKPLILQAQLTTSI